MFFATILIPKLTYMQTCGSVEILVFRYQSKWIELDYFVFRLVRLSEIIFFTL